MLKQKTSTQKKNIWTGPIPKDAPVFYRAVIERWDWNGPSLCYKVWRGVRETRIGWWVVEEESHISTIGSEARWMKKNARKQFAWPTKEQALESLVQRKIHEHEHAHRRLSHIKRQLLHLYKENPSHPDLEYMMENGLVYANTP